MYSYLYFPIKITCGLDFLETKQIVHRDIKPANMLINKSVMVNKNFMIKLCDFGICGNLSEVESDFSVVVGTAEYLPPKPKYCTIQGDMWALGISLLEVISDKHPFASWTLSAIPFKILMWKPTLPMPVSDDMQELILHL
jgi:serine/threonine protein kinase